MAVNARGTMLCYKHAGKQMIAQGRGGRIIGAHPAGFLFFLRTDPRIHQVHVRKPESRVISSLCVDARRKAYVMRTASSVVPTYSATKFAIRGLTQAAGTFFAGLDALH